MQSDFYKEAPLWVARTEPRRIFSRSGAALLLLRLPDDNGYIVATARETDAIADPASLLGGLLRSQCALLSLPYLSNN